MSRFGSVAATLLAVVAIGGGVASCSSEPAGADVLCGALDRGEVPAMALTQMNNADGGAPAGFTAAQDAARRAVGYIRETCSQHESTALLFESISTAPAPEGVAQDPMVSEEEAAAQDGGTAVAPEPTTLTLSVEGTATRATVQFSAGGSSGGGDEVDIPFTRQLTVQPDNRYSTLTASSPFGATGDLTCSITDDLGNVLDSQTAASQGGSYGSASVSCSAQ